MADNLVDERTARIVLYILVGIYLASLLAVAKFAHRRKVRAMAQGRELQAHFGGSFNAPLLWLTTFSTLYSGFTVVGVPDDAAKRGFVSFRWIGATVVISASMQMLYPRLRRLAIERQYSSPNDFVADRFGTRRLRLATAACSIIPMLLRVTAQLLSFAAMAQGFTGDAMPRWVAMLVLIVVVLVFEHLGGMNSVVLTDAVQSTLMLGSFLVVPFVLGGIFGFLPSMSPAECPNLVYVQNQTTNPDQIPGTCPSDGMGIPSGCVPAGCLPAVRPKFFLYPTHKDQADIAFFLLNMIATPLQPDMIQRSFVAASDGSLRFMMGAMAIAPFLAQTPGIMIGLTRAAWGPAWPEVDRNSTAFAAVSNALAGEGLGEYILVSVMTCATMAAIMSSTDSAILGASSVAVDVYRSVVDQSASERRLVLIGSLVSVALCGVAFLMAMFFSRDQMSEIMILLSGMLMQLLPAFGLGLHAAVRERAVFLGLLAGLLALLVMIGAGNPLARFYIPLVNVSVFINFLVVGAVQLLDVLGVWPSRSAAAAPGATVESERSGQEPDASGDDRRSGQLTTGAIRSMTAAVGQPSKALLALVLISVALALPWYRRPGAVEPIVAGVPLWGFVQLVLFTFAALVAVAAAASWRSDLSAAAAPCEKEAPQTAKGASCKARVVCVPGRLNGDCRSCP